MKPLPRGSVPARSMKVRMVSGCTITPKVNLQVVHRVITRHLLDQTGFKAFEADSGEVTLIQRFGSAANLNIHLHC